MLSMSASSETQLREPRALTSPPTDSNVLVLALGNRLCADDGIASAVLNELKACVAADLVTLIDGGTPGLETVLLLQGHRRAIIIDAAEMGERAGVWKRFTPAEVGWQPKLNGSSIHAAGLAEALSLGDALGLLPPQIVIYGIQPSSTARGDGLSPEVRAAIPGVVEAILADVRGAMRPDDEDR